MNNFQSANRTINQLVGVTKSNKVNTMKTTQSNNMQTLRSINGYYNVEVIGNLTIGATIEAYDKDGYLIMGYCGKVIDIKDGAITMGNGHNTVTSGIHRLEGAVIEVVN